MPAPFRLQSQGSGRLFAGVRNPLHKWPLYFFVAVSFWNLVGAGLFGFFINPPIALYYMQGLNLTPVHGHTALFGTRRARPHVQVSSHPGAGVVVEHEPVTLKYRTREIYPSPAPTTP